MAHSTQEKKKLLTRVRRIAGQMGALEKALESEADCELVLQQIAAVRGAVNGLMVEVLDGHIREHLGRLGDSHTSREREASRLVAVLRSYLK